VEAVRVTPTAENRPRGKLFLEQAPILLGSGRMLHRAWAELFARWNIAYRSFSRKNLDLARPETIGRSIGVDCRLLINCAAYTDVDGA